MGRIKRKGTTINKKEIALSFGLGFLFQKIIRYNSRYISLRMTREQGEQILEALDTWIEGYAISAEWAEDEELSGLFNSYGVITDVRDILWEEVNR